jgi:peroxiredoxin
MSASVPAIGSLAPDFTLETTTGHAVTLSSYRGTHHVLLAFFPLAFTGVCTEDFDVFTSKDVTVLPISVDSVPTLKEFKAKYGMKVELGSDFKREVATAYGVLHPAFFSTRAYFLIDKAGVVRWSYVEETPGTRRQNAELLAEIAKLAG